MRSIFVGIEYAGKSTLIGLLEEYYRRYKRPTHRDDHFTIPDSTLSPESRAQMVNFPNDIKERMQRMQIHYHIDIIKKYEYPLLGGWHIEEGIYAAVYGNDPDSPYYSNYGFGFQRKYETAVLEAHLPDVVLIHVTAGDEAIRQRMRENPHEYQIIKEEDIAKVKQCFEEEVEKSLFTSHGRKIVLDTTDKTPEASLDELLLLSEPLVSTAEMALRAHPLPEGDYEVRYEGGNRRMLPQEG